MAILFFFTSEDLFLTALARSVRIDDSPFTQRSQDAFRASSINCRPCSRMHIGGPCLAQQQGPQRRLSARSQWPSSAPGTSRAQPYPERRRRWRLSRAFDARTPTQQPQQSVFYGRGRFGQSEHRDVFKLEKLLLDCAGFGGLSRAPEQSLVTRPSPGLLFMSAREASVA